MRKLLGRANIPLLVISFWLSVTLWLIVQAQSMQMHPETISVPLKWDNLDPKFVITEIDESVPMNVEVPGDKSADVGLKSAIAVVDLSKANVGRHTYSAIIYANDPDIKRMFPRDNVKVIVRVEAKAAKTMTVSVEPKGRISDRNLRYEASAVEPSTVEFSGSQSRIDSIAKARVILDLGDVDPNDSERTFNLPIEALDAQGRPVAMVVPSQSLVRVHPTVEPAMVDKELFVIPSFAGHPAPGFEVSEYHAVPEKVVVTGESLVLAQTSSIYTDPIDVTGLTQSVTRDVTLQFPADLKLLHPRPVKVQIKVRKQTVLQSAPPPISSQVLPIFPHQTPATVPFRRGSH